MNALFRGERPSFPSNVRFRAIMEPLINEDNGISRLCWDDNPLIRPSLDFIEVY